MFKKIKEVEINGRTFHLVKNVDGDLAIRMAYENKAGHTSRGCPVVWVADMGSFFEAFSQFFDPNINLIKLCNSCKSVFSDLI